MLARYWWPGNIRELENLIERVVATCDGDWITDDDLPLDFHVAELDQRGGRRQPARSRAGDVRAQLHHPRARAQCAWNVTQTARYLGVPLSTLKFKMDRLEIREIARRIKGG